MRKRKDVKPEKGDEEVLLLEDLAPRKDVKGGAGKILFGEAVRPPDATRGESGDQRRKGDRGT